jgi:hypothetical protein
MSFSQGRWFAAARFALCGLAGMPVLIAHSQDVAESTGMAPTSAREGLARGAEHYILVARGQRGQTLRQLPSSNECGVSGGWLTLRDGWWLAGDTVVAGCKRVSSVGSTSISGNGLTHLVARVDSGPILVRGRPPNDTLAFLSLVLPGVLPQSYTSVGLLHHDSLLVYSVNLGGESIYLRVGR